MRYSDYKCDGCNKIFEADDDIVVCPLCATPQHRHCYNEKGECVNSHLHSESYQWKGEKEVSPEKSGTQENVVKEETAQPLFCPNCNYENEHGSTECRNCGMKFTIFGFNVAEAAQESQQEEKNADDIIDPTVSPKMTPPDYPAPFSLESDDDKENANAETSLPGNSEEQMEQFLTHTIMNSTGYGVTEKNDEGLFKGPYPDDMKIDGIHANTMGAFIARNAEKYIEKFRKISSGNKLSFNWAAFVFSPYWFFYRKLYKPGIIFMTLKLCLSILSTPVSLEFAEYYSSFMQKDFEAMSEQALLEAFDKLYVLAEPVFIWMGIMFLLNLVAGFAANLLYRRYTVAQLTKIENEPNRNRKLTDLLKFGGVAPLIAMTSFLAEEVLSMIAGMFF